MRALSFLVVLLFAAGISAQSATVKQPFDEATMLARSGDFGSALTHYRAALTNAQEEPVEEEFLAKLYYNLGVCEFRLERHASATEYLGRAIELTGGSYTKAYYALGMTQSALEKWSDARRAFWKVIEANGRDGEAWFDMAIARLGDNDIDGAENAFRNAIAFKSIDMAMSHNNIGVIFALKGDLDGAMKEFEAALTASGGQLTVAKNNLEYCRSHAGQLRSEYKIARRGFSAY